MSPQKPLLKSVLLLLVFSSQPPTQLQHRTLEPALNLPSPGSSQTVSHISGLGSTATTLGTLEHCPQGPTVWAFGKPEKQRLPQRLPQADPDAGRCNQGTCSKRDGLFRSVICPPSPLQCIDASWKNSVDLGYRNPLSSPSACS